jgi:hypothetical protein
MNNWMSSLRTRLRVGLGQRPPAGASAAETAEDVVAAAAPEAPLAAEAPAAGAAAFAVFRRQPVRLVVARVVTVLAGLLLLFALVVPNELGQLTPAAFVRIPVEAVVGVVLVALLPARAARIAAAISGLVLGILTVVSFIDMGFYTAFARPFHPVYDWNYFGSAVDFVTRSLGRGGAIAAAVVAVVLAVALPVLMTLAATRLAGLVNRNRTTGMRTAAVLGVVWVTCAAFAVQIVPGVPVAATSATRLAYDRASQVAEDLRDQQAFESGIGVDAFRDVPPERLLTALRGKDVIIAFVESYGRVAVEGPEIAPQIDALLAAGDRRLRAAGFAARSAFLTSPTSGGGSWLAHSTLQSGLWIHNQARYGTLLESDRLTLSSAFRRAGWRSVGVMPANRGPWPEGQAFYGFETIYDLASIGYRGPDFSFATVPDQYTLAAFQRLERSTPNRASVVAEIGLTSSHAPWSPVPPLLDWDELGDGSVYSVPSGAGDPADIVFQRDLSRVRADFAHSISYSLETLLSYVETYGDDDLVLILLGDHQPVPLIAGDDASRDAPITILTRDEAVLDRISDWGWQDGLNPDPQAPVWRMDAFRDRFLTAFGPRA